MSGVTATPRLVWLEPVPLVFCHRIASARIFGSDVNVLYYAMREIDGEIVGVPNLELVRPLEDCRRMTLRDMLDRQLAAGERPQIAMH